MQSIPSVSPGRGAAGAPLEFLARTVGELLAFGYLRHMRAAREAAEKGFARAHKGLDDVAPSARVSPGPEGPLNGGTIDER
jgi:hypothetical protein